MKATSLLHSDSQLNQTNYYEADVQRGPVGMALRGAVQVDALVVGAGFAGLSAAIELAQRGQRVVVLEADRVCSGASGRNGGQALVGYASGQRPWVEQLGRSDARRAWDMSVEAIRLLDERIVQHRIDCDRVHGYLRVADSPRKARALQADLQALHDDYDFESKLYKGDEVRQHIDSPRYCAAAFESVSGHLHPLKFGLGLARAARALGVQIYEQSPVQDIRRGQHLVAFTPHGTVKARFGVLAGNCTLSEYGPTVAPEIASRIMPVGNYMISTEPLAPALRQSLIPSHAAVSDNNFVQDYFRFSADHRMLFGARVGYSAATPTYLKGMLRRRMLQVFPAIHRVRVAFVWGGFADISRNRAPDFGRLGHNLYYLQGFSGHGLTLALLAGRLVAEAVAGQAERFDVFARLRHRKFPGGPLLRVPSLVLGSLYHRLKDLL